MSGRLLPCRACARHVVSSDVRCPFCGSSTAPLVASSAALRGCDGLVRAALVTSLAIGASACSPDAPLNADPAVDAGDAGLSSDGAGAVTDAGSVVAMYGAPASCDVALSSRVGDPFAIGVLSAVASAALARRRRRPGASEP